VLAAGTFGEKDDAPVENLIGSNLAEAANAAARPPVETGSDGSDRFDCIHGLDPPLEWAVTYWSAGA
jgi:hypothetical protein